MPISRRAPYPFRLASLLSTRPTTQQSAEDCDQCTLSARQLRCSSTLPQQSLAKTSNTSNLERWPQPLVTSTIHIGKGESSTVLIPSRLPHRWRFCAAFSQRTSAGHRRNCVEDSETTAEIHSFMDIHGLETMHALPWECQYTPDVCMLSHLLTYSWSKSPPHLSSPNRKRSFNASSTNSLAKVWIPGTVPRQFFANHFPEHYRLSCSMASDY